MQYIAQTQIDGKLVNGYSDSSIADAVFNLGQELPVGTYTVMCFSEDIEGKVVWLGTAVHQWA